MNNLVLIGFKAAGKTTLGRLVAARCQKPFIDTDDLFLEPPSVAYEKFGEVAFRDQEHRHLQTLARLSGYVIATGGGTVCDARNHSLLRQLGTIVHLHTPQELIKQRLFSSQFPAFLKGPEVSFESLYHNRLGIYLAIAHHNITCEDEIWEVIHSDPFSV